MYVSLYLCISVCVSVCLSVCLSVCQNCENKSLFFSVIEFSKLHLDIRVLPTKKEFQRLSKASENKLETTPKSYQPPPSTSANFRPVKIHKFPLLFPFFRFIKQQQREPSSKEATLSNLKRAANITTYNVRDLSPLDCCSWKSEAKFRTSKAIELSCSTFFSVNTH